jgi:hypothetical protein
MNMLLGENLASSYSTSQATNEVLTGERLVDTWYAEASLYNYNVNSVQHEAQNFTQLVWRDSNEAGYGRARSLNGMWYGVGLYAPGGNVASKFRDNVYPPIK